MISDEGKGLGMAVSLFVGLGLITMGGVTAKFNYDKHIGTPKNVTERAMDSYPEAKAYEDDVRKIAREYATCKGGLLADPVQPELVYFSTKRTLSDYYMLRDEGVNIYLEDVAGIMKALNKASKKDSDAKKLNSAVSEVLSHSKKYSPKGLESFITKLDFFYNDGDDTVQDFDLAVEYAAEACQERGCRLHDVGIKLDLVRFFGSSDALEENLSVKSFPNHFDKLYPREAVPELPGTPQPAPVEAEQVELESGQPEAGQVEAEQVPLEVPKVKEVEFPPIAIAQFLENPKAYFSKKVEISAYPALQTLSEDSGRYVLTLDDDTDFIHCYDTGGIDLDNHLVFHDIEMIIRHNEKSVDRKKVMVQGTLWDNALSLSYIEVNGIRREF
ncbi:MAG: hypothetical protein ABIB71_08885 [Candidatus Woesearchaeota archaeon]